MNTVEPICMHGLLLLSTYTGIFNIYLFNGIFNITLVLNAFYYHIKFMVSGHNPEEGQNAVLTKTCFYIWFNSSIVRTPVNRQATRAAK